MTMSHNQVSAKIYQFPARGRFASDSQGDDKPAANLSSPRIARVASGSGWYHDEAIQEAERTRRT
jgi:Protein of unknown function (DUF2735)